MVLRIAGYVAASLLLERQPRQWHVLAVLDARVKPTDFLESAALSHAYLTFDDVEQAALDKRPPTEAWVTQGLEFAESKDPLLVCCRAGRGRSVALAYLICWRAHGAAEAIALLDPTRHRPNRLVIAIGSSLLNDPEILEQFDAWRQRHAHVRLADYYSEMETEFEALLREGGRDRITGADLGA